MIRWPAEQISFDFRFTFSRRAVTLPRLKTALVLLFFGAFVFFSVHLKTEMRHQRSPVLALKLKEPMPDFTVVDLAGKPVKFSQLAKGKRVVAINFWATWCAPCRMEMPGFEKLFREKAKDGFTLLAINEDKERPKLDAYLKEKPVTFPVLIDQEQKLAERFGVNAFPTTILVGADGRVERIFEGVQPYLEYQIEGLLKRGKEGDE